MLTELITNVIGFSYNAFIALCLYFEYLENDGIFCLFLFFRLFFLILLEIREWRIVLLNFFLEDFDSLISQTAEVTRLVDDTDWISDLCKGDFRNFAQRISKYLFFLRRHLKKPSSNFFFVTVFVFCSVKNLLTNTHSLFVAARREPSANATVISVAILYGSALLAEPLESVVNAIKNVQEIQVCLA